MAECARVLRPGGRLCVSEPPSTRRTCPRRSSPAPPPGPHAWPAHSPRTTSYANSPAPASRTSRSSTAAPLSNDVRTLYPLFDADTIALMRRLVPAARQDAVAVAVVVRARKAA
ncbi:hypothetical protein [Streptomyces caniscabiei]|nr:hypothetical protein [Streptomyces caniscabiei]MBE4735119.1 hypothetical protein [Streptomyces caniscabiei]MBE4754253.1 hypothetical protein [Streptomyces caniscabiei]MBE4767845.1 hypothetical protein [Streptomyces caniscabiei]MDX2953551.1 hypothetical protein [Streptomyces caniscabiei]